MSQRLAWVGLIGVLAVQTVGGATFNITTAAQLVAAINSANVAAGPHTINLAPGTYNLSGQLPVIAAGRAITFQGATANPGDTVLRQTTANTRILETAFAGSPNNVVLTFKNLTFENGQGGSYGGGALLVGGIGSSTTASNCVFQGNLTSAGSGVKAGGAIENSPNGDLTVIGCVFRNNSSVVYGGAIDFLNQAGGAGNLVVSNSVFIGNSAASDGGAIKASAGPGSITIVNCSFEGNQVTSGAARGGAVAHGDGAITLRHNRFFSSTAAIHANGDTLFQPSGAPALDASRNWWGQNSGPGATDIFAVGTVTASTWLQLRFAAGAPILGSGGSTTLTADLLGLNSGGTVPAADLAGLPALPSVPFPIFHSAVLGSVSPPSTQFAQGIATAAFTAGAIGGIGSVAASLDNQTLNTSFVINPPPTAPSQTFVRTRGLTLKIAITDVLAACASPSGDALSLSSIGSSAQGATLATTTTHILYQPASGNDNDDSFSYTISDALGGTATGQINVSVIMPGGLVQTIDTSAGTVTLHFAGIPGYTYDIQRASAPTGPWEDRAMPTAPASGLFSFTDDSPPVPAAFYRLRQH